MVSEGTGAICDFCFGIIAKPDDIVTVDVKDNAPPEERHYHRLCWEKIRADDAVERRRL